MPKITSAFPSLFRKRLSDPTPLAGPKATTRSRSATWLARSNTGRPIEGFVVEALGARRGHLIFGPLSVFNGIVSFTLKERLYNVLVSVTFRGLTEFNGKHLAFINETEVLYQGDLEPGLRTFYFAIRFPPVNLPPTSVAPEVRYNFVAQVKPIAYESDAPMRQLYVSKPLELTFVPYVDPFAPSQFETMNERNALEDSSTAKEGNTIGDQEPTETQGSKPRLQVFTYFPPPSPSVDPTNKAQSVKALPFPGVEKSSVIMDGHNRPIAKLRVQLPKATFIPGDGISCTITLTVPRGGHMPKGFMASVIERRWLGFEQDEDADLVSDYDPEQVGKRGSKSSQIYNRTLASAKFPIHPNSAVRLRREEIPSSESTRNTDTSLESGLDVVEQLSVKLPDFRTFVSDALLPTASLPLGPCYSQLAPVTPITPNAETPGSSIKGKEPVRPASRRTVSTIKSSQSNAVHGLHLVIQHFFHIEVPLTSGTIIKKSSGILLVELPITIGNKTPDVDLSHQLNKPSTPVLTVTTPDVVVSPPNELQESGELRREASKASFKREPSPLKLSTSAYLGGESASLAPSVASSSKSRENFTGSVRSGAGGEKRGVTFNTMANQDQGSVRWRRGERFPTLEEAKETPVFIKS